MTHRAQLLWFSDCPNHAVARQMLVETIERLAPGTYIEDIDASDPVHAAELRFPGSPTIRIDEVDIEPGFQDPGEYAPRCRLYRTSEGLRGVPERAWIEMALSR
jgi:hypothetical protein